MIKIECKELRLLASQGAETDAAERAAAAVNEWVHARPHVRVINIETLLDPPPRIVGARVWYEVRVGPG